MLGVVVFEAITISSDVVTGGKFATLIKPLGIRTNCEQFVLGKVYHTNIWNGVGDYMIYKNKKNMMIVLLIGICTFCILFISSKQLSIECLVQ